MRYDRPKERVCTLKIANYQDLARRVSGDDFVIINTEGRPMRLDNIRIKTWYNALRALEIRSRKPSATRHTFISVMLSYGMNPKRVAELVGNSQETIEKHYGKFIRYDELAGLKAIEASAKSATETVESQKLSKYKGKEWWSQRDSNTSGGPPQRRQKSSLSP